MQTILLFKCRGNPYHECNIFKIRSAEAFLRIFSIQKVFLKNLQCLHKNNCRSPLFNKIATSFRNSHCKFSNFRGCLFLSFDLAPSICYGIREIIFIHNLVFENILHEYFYSFCPRVWPYANHSQSRYSPGIVFQSTHKKWRFLLRISSVNVTKSTGNCRFNRTY